MTPHVGQISKAMMFIRGNDKFKCTMTYSPQNDTIVFHDIHFPENTHSSVVERFLEDGQRAFYKKLEDELDGITESNISGWLYKGTDT